MRYYFFQTSMQDRGKGPQPTLRALPGQTFEDGTPVDENLNVQAPKEIGTSLNGTRLEYPDGTYFCSSHLEMVTTANGVEYYSVFPKDSNGAPVKNPDFHPVSDDPNFQYVSPVHRSDAMNIAFVKFQTFGEQEVDGTEKKKTAARKFGKKLSPFDGKGNARPVGKGYTENYTDQVETEGTLIALWLRNVLLNMGIRTPLVRPKYDAAIGNIISDLYSAGESINSITNKERFNAVCKAQKMDDSGLKNINVGPLNWYLSELLREHSKGLSCTAIERDPVAEGEDVTNLINTAMNTMLGTSLGYTAANVADTRDALTMGWTLDEIIDPSVLGQKDNITELLGAIKSGEIALPAGAGKNGLTLLEKLMADKKNAAPQNKDGFHVDQLIWKLLVRNVHVHKNTLLTGPTGSGKTELLRLVCERLGKPLKIIPMGTITDPTEQLVGKMDLDPATGGTKFDWADFALAVQRPGVILLDEINRCPKNGNNYLYSVLDGTGILAASGAKSTDQREIKVNPDCVFVATANIGYEYTGTQELDPALKGRFMEIELDYMDHKQEAEILSKRTGITKDDATNIALIAENIRKSFYSGTLEHAVSTRETLMCAELVRDGFEVEDALQLAFLPSFERGVTEKDPNSERGKVRAMIASRFNNV